MTLESSILDHFGGIEPNDLIKITELNNIGIRNGEINQIVKHSKYYDGDSFLQFKKQNINQFTILSSNIESIHSKINIIQANVDSYGSNDFEFDALCFQECWLSDESTNHIQIDGYHCIYQGKSCSVKGLVIYLRNKYNYEIRKSINDSDIWEGIFIDIKDGGLKRLLTLGNIYIVHLEI